MSDDETEPTNDARRIALAIQLLTSLDERLTAIAATMPGAKPLAKELHDLGRALKAIRKLEGKK